MPYKNHFLNLSRTGGVSVYCFRLPQTERHAHRNRFIDPVYEMLAQKNKFLHAHNREAILLLINFNRSTNNLTPQEICNANE
jgi:hypothetical protein